MATPDLDTLRIELGDIVDLFASVDRPAPRPTIDPSEMRTGVRPGNRRPRRHRAFAALGGGW